MNKLKVFLTVALTLVISASVVFAINMTVNEMLEIQNRATNEVTFGAFPGGDIYQDVNFFQKEISYNRTMATTSSLEASTLLAREITRYERIEYDNSSDGGADGLHTLTLPASSTLTHFLPVNGSCTHTLIVNNEATAASSTTITAGTGVAINEATDGAEILGGTQTADLMWCRNYSGTSANDFTVYITEYTASD